jgi:N-acetylmuramoyl-L-alanine amidase
MLKKIGYVIILICFLIGLFFGIKIAFTKNDFNFSASNVRIDKIFQNVESRNVIVTKLYTYGRSLGFEGKLSNIEKDNFENARLIVVDGNGFEQSAKLNGYFENGYLILKSNDKINNTILIDKLENNDYYVYIRLKLNNSAEPRYYSLENETSIDELTYFTITKDGLNRKMTATFKEEEVKNRTYKYLTFSLENSILPDDTYDIVIDAGHGGKDRGEFSNGVSEANLTLEYAKMLKEALEAKGYKVAMTRTDENNDTYTYNNMYGQNGRIGLACQTHAKLMISLHVNSGFIALNGAEVYCPCNSDINFAKDLANKIVEKTSIEYSSNNTNKVANGVYVEGYTEKNIKELAESAKNKGYEPYAITTDTTYKYTIREVGGLATNAYVDGRNPAYEKNPYYNSPSGIECYQLELGYIKTDLDKLLSEKAAYVEAISEAIENNF